MMQHNPSRPRRGSRPYGAGFPGLQILFNRLLGNHDAAPTEADSAESQLPRAS
jgi:hypothetical protein